MTDPVLRAVAKMREDGFDVSPADIRAALFVMLDAREIASIIWSSDYDYADPAKFDAQDVETRNEYFSNAYALRAYIIGGDQ